MSGRWLYVIPDLKLVRKLLDRGAALVWEPMLLVHYRSGRIERKILFDLWLPDLLERPELRVALCRDASRFRLSDHAPIDGLEPEAAGDLESVLEDIRQLAMRVFSPEQRAREQQQIREGLSVFAHDARERFIRFMMPTRSLTLPESVLIREILETGLGIRPDARLEVVNHLPVRYPLVVTWNLEVYEPAFSKKVSKSYTQVFRQREVLEQLKKLLKSSSLAHELT